MDWQHWFSKSGGRYGSVETMRHERWARDVYLTEAQARVMMRVGAGWSGHERQLAVDLGLPRSTVRHALDRLASLWLVKVQRTVGRAGGTVVGAIRGWVNRTRQERLVRLWSEMDQPKSSVENQEERERVTLGWSISPGLASCRAVMERLSRG